MAGRVSLKLLSVVVFGAAVGLAPLALGAANEGGGMGMSGGANMGGASAGSDTAAIYQRGVQELQAHDYHAAVSDLRHVQRTAPYDANVNYVLGLAYVGDNDNQHAREPLERAARNAHPPLGVHLLLGTVYIALGNHDGAVAQQTTLQTLLAACDAACGDAQRAQIQTQLDALTQALAAPATPATPATPAAPATAPTSSAAPTIGWNFPTVPEGRAAYAEAVGLMNQQRYSEALVALDRAEAAIGPHPDILNYKGFTNRRLGRPDEALTYYREALALDPNHRGANEYLGERYLQMGRIDDARRQLARLDHLCAYGCAEREELQHWIELASNDAPTAH